MKNKKSQMFSLIAIMLLFLFFSSYGIYSIMQDREKTKNRVESMDSFLFSLEKNMERQLYVAGFRIIFLTNDKITRTGEYISDFESIFYEGIWNGTMEGESEEILDGVTLEEIEKAIQKEANKVNIDIKILNKEPFIKHENPWTVTIGLNFTLNMTDVSNLASWNREESIKAHVEIERFEDPLYFVSTNGIVSRKINKTTYENNYVSGNDVTNLSNHLENKLYTHNPNAPSFLNRLEGDMSPSEHGIESFVHIPELSRQGLSTEEKTLVDHIYFSDKDPDHFQIDNMPSWFRIDNVNDRLTKYQVENITI